MRKLHLGLKSMPNFFVLGPQLGWLQPLLYLNFKLKEKNLKNLIFSPKKLLISSNLPKEHWKKIKKPKIILSFIALKGVCHEIFDLQFFS